MLHRSGPPRRKAVAVTDTVCARHRNVSKTQSHTDLHDPSMFEEFSFIADHVSVTLA